LVFCMREVSKVVEKTPSGDRASSRESWLRTTQRLWFIRKVGLYRIDH
jgi:hypothetical protein